MELLQFYIKNISVKRHTRSKGKWQLRNAEDSNIASRSAKCTVSAINLYTNNYRVITNVTK